MQKFIQYACILPCCISSLFSAAQAEDAKIDKPTTQKQKISKIVVANNPIFNESESDAFFIHRWANSLHINTKEYVVLDNLTFSENDTITQKDLDESQRLLRAVP
ncbi:MAG: hypothetical protein ACRCWP_01030, partial [Shewanella sp.]